MLAALKFRLARRGASLQDIVSWSLAQVVADRARTAFRCHRYDRKGPCDGFVYMLSLTGEYGGVRLASPYWREGDYFFRSFPYMRGWI